MNNYVAEPTQYPSTIKTHGYESKKAYDKRFEKSGIERAELYAAKLSFERAQLEEFGKNWKQTIRQISARFRPFRKSIVSGTKIIAQWN